MKRPLRVWMTGCVAVVMAAAGASREVFAEERVLHASRYGVAETLERLHACAPRHGLDVFTRVVQPAAAWRGARAEPASTVLVFAPLGADHTPVLMQDDHGAPEVPLALRVRANAQGGTEVVISGADWEGLPAELTRSLTELPALVADALG